LVLDILTNKINLKLFKFQLQVWAKMIYLPQGTQKIYHHKAPTLLQQLSLQY